MTDFWWGVITVLGVELLFALLIFLRAWRRDFTRWNP